MYVLCILGLIQFVVCFIFVVDIFPFTLDGYIQSTPRRIIRIHSILSEAGNLGTCLIPVISYILFDKEYYKNNKGKSVVFILTILLTFATISYVLLAILFFVKIYNKFSKLKLIFLSLALVFLGFGIKTMTSNVENTSIDQSKFIGMIQKKIVETLQFSADSSVEDFEELNASSYALLTNFKVAISAPSRITGTGLGSHEQNYKRVHPANDFYLYGLNSRDGYSLFVRILSEFGIIGIVLYIILLVKNYNSDNIINKCVLFFFLALLIRGGHYTLYGIIFLHFMYFHTSKMAIQSLNSRMKIN
jgi:hypothetical protein